MPQPYRLTTPRVQPLHLSEMASGIQEMLQRPGGFEHGEVLNVFASLALHRE